MFGIFKMGRLLRLNKIVQFLNVDEDSKATMKLTIMIIFLTIYMHCWACVWWMLVRNEKNWIPYMEQREDGRDMYALYYKTIGS